MTHSLALQVARKNFLQLSYKKVTSFKLKPLTLRTSQFESDEMIHQILGKLFHELSRLETWRLSVWWIVKNFS